jgi:hypothetical protein
MIAAGLLFAAPASAHKLTLGKAAPFGAFPGDCGNCEAFETDTAASSPSYAVPKGKWKIVSWKATGSTTKNADAKLRVYRPTDVKGQYELIAESDQEAIAKNTRPSHDTRIRVKHGDLLGIRTSGFLPIVYQTDKVGDEITAPFGCTPVVGDLVGTGAGCATSSTAGRRANIAAKLVKRH